MKNLTLQLLLVLTISLSAQMEKIPLLEPISNTIPESFIIEGSGNELITFWIDSTDLHMSKSLDDGLTWGTSKILVDNTILRDSLSDLNVLKINSGRILVTYKQKFHYLIYSDDNGSTWSEPAKLVTDIGIIRPRKIMESSLSQTNDDKIWFVYNRQNKIYNIQSDDGVTWSEKNTMITVEDGPPHFSSVNSHWNNSLVLIYRKSNADTSNIYELTSIDSGKTWSNPKIILDNGLNKERPRVTKGSNNTLWLTFVQPELTPFEEYTQSNIYYSKLEDGAYSWGSPNKFTEYVDFDGGQNISRVNDKQYITFISNRDGAYTLWYGIADESNDESAIPAVYNTEFHFLNNNPKANVNINSKVYSQNTLNSVMFYYTLSNVLDSLQLFDDGLNNDDAAGDFIFGNDLLNIPYNFLFQYQISATDIYGNRVLTPSKSVSSPFGGDGGDGFYFDNNNLRLPINSRGVIADFKIGNRKTGGRFDDIGVIFSAGFALSGYTNGNLWANGMMTASRIEDYEAGTVANPESYTEFYVVRRLLPDFHYSWTDWKNAVEQGGDFYDGDGDGIYNPVDLNGNGTWDTNEDKPDMIGDVTAFTVYNDGVSSQFRTFSNVEPQGIEIKQTAFSYNVPTSPELANVIFFRYKIENMGTVADKLDSVYFGAWADLDNGEYIDDLIGIDSTLNSSYTYNDGEDEDFGINPPAIFVSFVQAPPVYIEGETFIDTDGNGVYDEGIDTPLDSARNRKGELLGVEEYPGAKNNVISSNIWLPHNALDNESQLRDYMLGFNKGGDLVDPCNWEFGKVFNEDCSSINPSLMYSGNPVTQNGWINSSPDDQRQFGSTGPFDLVKGKPIEIIVAYIVGRGTDALNSITEARRITNDVIGFYNTNFSYVPVGVNGNKGSQLPTEYSLSQNYPNPFNPSTTIKYTIPSVQTPLLGGVGGGLVTLKVYDILGREVATLVNKQQKAGNYEVSFDASNLTSGVYFYRLHAGSFVESKKMILLK
ncbi:MAG: exo-alpha-sialidase [Melioribacteraceae bacterium]|nr:exo-alpha-sialidase [Melioribacteraceae bacterium]